MEERYTRRQWLALGLTAAAGGIAGCSEGDGGDGDDGSGDNTSDGDSDGGDGGTSDGSDDGSGAGTFGDSVEYPTSYAFSMTIEDGGTTTTVNGRFHEGNIYYEAVLEGSQNVEFYNVGGDTFVITQDICFKNPDGTQNPVSFDPESYTSRDELQEAAENNPNVEPVETTTIDGQEVRVYEISDMQGNTARYYILTDSGFPRRIEFDTFQIDLTDHNDVNAISAPDMNCQEM